MLLSINKKLIALRFPQIPYICSEKIETSCGSIAKKSLQLVVKSKCARSWRSTRCEKAEW